MTTVLPITMSFTILCYIVAAFYVTIWFFDSFFKSCMHYPYFTFLEGTGLKIGVFNFTWTTSVFNRPIYRWSKILSRFLNKWFTCGYLFTVIIFLPFSLWTLTSFIMERFSDSIDVSSVPEIKAIVPGINVPFSDFWLYFYTLGFCSIIHELGHAMAAAQEDVPIILIGMQVFAIIPIAFVHLNSEHLNSLPRTKRLKIYCAGVWHNIATAFLTLLLYFSTPVLFSIGYETGLGVKVTGLSEDSPLRHSRGLHKEDIITSISGCEVKNTNDWLYCLHMAHERYGICTSAEFIAQNDEIAMETIVNDVVECCRKEDVYSFCFEYMEPKTAGDSALPGQYACLKPREMVKNKFIKCTDGGGHMCPRNMHCMKPLLAAHTHLLIVERKSNNSIVYLGLPYDLHKTVFVDQYFPRVSFLTHFSPNEIEKMLRYIFMFSMGIAFLNIIPCYGTDGHHIARNVIQVLARFLNKDDKFVTVATISTVVVGTGVVVPTLVYLFYKTIVDSFH